jgi:hypothetical protein
LDEFQLEQGGQVCHVRRIDRPVESAIEQEAAESSAHRTAHVVIEIITHAENLSPGQTKLAARSFEKERMRFPITDFRRNH